MIRILKFYLLTILVLSTAVFAIASLSVGLDSKAADVWQAWAVVTALVGIMMLLIFTPIQWLAISLKRPWLAYVGCALFNPLLYLGDWVYRAYQDFALGIPFSLASLEDYLDGRWGSVVASVFLGVAFTYIYQRWFPKPINP